jgi:hypothetical protein
MFNNKPMTEDQAKAVYAVLKDECGAQGGSMEDGFVYEFTISESNQYGPTTEWRFQGSLGFGGKFRYPKMSVDCYREDETPARLAAIERANDRLALLKASFNTAPAMAA